MAVDAVRDTADRLESSAESRRTEHRQRLTRQMLQELLSYMMKNRCLDAWGPAGGGGGGVGDWVFAASFDCGVLILRM